eukprot:5471370-Heterocapsa_arctica.AAC.1
MAGLMDALRGPLLKIREERFMPAARGRGDGPQWRAARGRPTRPQRTTTGNEARARLAWLRPVPLPPALHRLVTTGGA